MKNILSLAIIALVAFASVNCSSVGRKDVVISLDQVHTDAAFKQFKKANKMNQLEIVTDLLRQANDEYKVCETIDEIRDLREDLVLIQRYIVSGKQGFMAAQKEYNILYNKINKTIREYEGGSTIYHETGGYYDFGQELD